MQKILTLYPNLQTNFFGEFRLKEMANKNRFEVELSILQNWWNSFPVLFSFGFFFYSAKMHFFLRLYPIFPRKPGGVLFASLEVRRLTKLLVSHGQKKNFLLAMCQNFVLLLTRLFFREKGRKYCVWKVLRGWK